MESFDIFSFSRTAARRQGEVAVAALPRLVESVLRPAGTLGYQCAGGVDAQDRPSLRLCLHGTLLLRCDRCGEEVSWPLECELVFYFVRSEAELAAIPVDDSAEEPLLGSAHFDLVPLIEDEVILQLPISPRHPACSPPQREKSFDFERAERPRPFAELARLRKVDGVR